MIDKKKIGICGMVFVTFIFLLVRSTVVVAENESIIIQPRQEIDHKTDKKKAEKWAKEKYEHWEKEVNSFQKEAINNALEGKQEYKSDEQLNHHLQYFGGDFDNVTEESDSLAYHYKQKYEADMKLMDSVFKLSEGKTKEALYVYKNVSLANILNSEFGEDPFSFDQNLKSGFTNINRDIFRSIKSGLEYGIDSSYVVTDIAEETGGEGRLKLRIRVPVGTPSAYDGKNRLVFDKNYGLLIKDMSIIVQNGKEYIRINADLVEKSVIDKKIEPYREETQGFINERFPQNNNPEFIKYDFRGLGASMSVERVHPELEKALELMDPEFTDYFFNFLFENDMKFIFTDLPIWAVENQKPIPWHSEKDTISGLTIITFGRFNIVIRMPYSFTDIGTGLSGNTHETLLHELGHAADRFFSGSLWSKISFTKEFDEIFSKERYNITPYAASSPTEFFAEAFRFYHTSKEELKEKAPEVYAFIENQIEKTINA